MRSKRAMFCNSIFKQYFITTMLIIITSFITLGGMFLIFVTSYWGNEKQSLLESNAAAVSKIVSNNSKSINDNLVVIDNILIREFISTFSQNIDADIFVTDLQGNTLLCSHDSLCNHTKEKVPLDIINKALLDGKYAQVTSLYDNNCYVVAVPVVVTVKGQDTNLGVVITTTDTGYINEFRKDIFKLLILASLLAFVVSFFIIWILSYNLAKPLSEMSDAAKRFAKGDFSKRVPVRRSDEIGQLSVAFNNMADSLSKSEETRRSFIANVSHELKTPMTTVAGFIDGILDGTIPPSKSMYYLDIVSSEVKRLSRLVTTMLSLSRIDSGSLRINYQKFDLSSIVFKSLLSFESKIEEKQIEIKGIESTKPIYLNGDPDMIHQVVYNLIENAVKFTNSNGYIKIELTSSKKTANFKIKNSGHGISKNDLNFIFDKFYKTDKSRSQDKNGMGLGLYIVKTIINLHQGEIYAHSIEGEFCEFEFYIPLNLENNKTFKNKKEEK